MKYQFSEDYLRYARANANKLYIIIQKREKKENADESVRVVWRVNEI